MFKLFAFLILLFATGPAVAQTAAVPEPGTYALMAGGLALMGLRLRRQAAA